MQRRMKNTGSNMLKPSQSAEACRVAEHEHSHGCLFFPHYTSLKTDLLSVCENQRLQTTICLDTYVFLLQNTICLDTDVFLLQTTICLDAEVFLLQTTIYLDAYVFLLQTTICLDTDVFMLQTTFCLDADVFLLQTTIYLDAYVFLLQTTIMSICLDAEVFLLQTIIYLDTDSFVFSDYTAWLTAPMHLIMNSKCFQVSRCLTKSNFVYTNIYIKNTKTKITFHC